MTETVKEKIAFEVETGRILKILASEIYDSPKAFLRENVQNAYDAILMRCTEENLPEKERKIDITVEPNRLTVCDDGIGMTEDVLKNNFWKAGASGKKSELAQRSGVIGTFGIGAMANFGVCSALHVETRNRESKFTLVSSAKRDDLKISQNCIDLERVSENREPGTIVIADLDPDNPIDEANACQYLSQYVRFLPVPVRVNGNLISQENFEDTLEGRARGFKKVSSQEVSRDAFTGMLHVSINEQHRVLVRFTDIKMSGTPIQGEMFFVQDGGVTHGFRNLFGLAPLPLSGGYNFGGFVNLDILHPTAGREALSRDSIQHVNNMLAIIEAEVSQIVADTTAADINQQFQKYILSKNLVNLARGVKILVRPSEDKMIPLGSVAAYEPDKVKHYYTGRDPTILKQHANNQANLFHVSRENPRRKLQIRYLDQIAKLEPIPDDISVERILPEQLDLAEAMFLLSLRNILLNDYLMPDIDAAFAEISHGVELDVREKDKVLQVSIARNISSVSTVIECYREAHDVFEGFMKDFVREYVYPHIRNYVPSSTNQGAEALYKRIKKNKELFRLQESDYGAIELLLADYLAGKTDFSEILKASRSRVAVQSQHVGRAQIGRVELELPDIIQHDSSVPPPNKLEAAPPIIRDDLESDMKVLTVSKAYQKLNDFRMFLAVSDRMMKREGEFLRWPHTTKLIWGTHRITYIFTDASENFSLYYDIELKSPLEINQTGGEMFPTTTIITKNRIFIPVPKNLEPAFQITDGDKEFHVRFDTIP